MKSVSNAMSNIGDRSMEGTEVLDGSQQVEEDSKKMTNNLILHEDSRECGSTFLNELKPPMYNSSH